MSTIIHFMDVGQGNMTLIETSDGSNYLFDCNLIGDLEDDIIDYLGNAIGYGTKINGFICSHRDADHMRGIRELDCNFPIKKIWDSDYPGTTTNSTEYQEYMQLRRRVGVNVVKRKTKLDLGRTRFRFMSAKDERLPQNANAQGIVMKVEHLSQNGGQALGSVMLTGDSDAETWRYGVMKDYKAADVGCDVLVAGHHGSITFFDDPKHNLYYTRHVEKMSPAMTIVSVGRNAHGHPDKNALRLYEQYSRGSPNRGTKVVRTDSKGNIRLILKDDGGWSMTYR